MISMKIENAQAIQNALNKFENKIAKKIVRDGLKKSFKPVLKRIKVNARALDTGRKKGKKASQRIGHRIATALKMQPFRKQKKGSYGLKIWIPSKNAEQFIEISERTGHRNYIPMAIEYGHAFPGRGLGGGRGAPKDVPAKSFMRKELDYARTEPINKFRQEIIRAIRKENMKR